MYLALGFLAVRQMMLIDWLTAGCVLCFLYYWETGEVLFIDEYFKIVREHGRSKEQVSAAIPVTICEPFITLAAARQELRVFHGGAERKEGNWSRLHPSPVAGSDAYGIHKVYNRDLDERDGDLNDVESTPGDSVAVYTCEVRASLTEVQKARHSPRLRVPDTLLYHFTDLGNVPEPVATSSTLVSSPGASDLSSQNELLRANLSRTRRMLHAQMSKLGGKLREANARCAEL